MKLTQLSLGEYSARAAVVQALDQGLVRYKSFGLYSCVIADRSVFPALDELGIRHIPADQTMKGNEYVHVIAFPDWSNVFGNLGRTNHLFEGTIH